MAVSDTSGVQPPDVKYARSGDVAIAYQTVGSGAPDIVFMRAPGGRPLSTWEQPLLVRHVEGLAANGRVLLLDKRGTGLSDRVREVQSLETAMDDVRAVMDDAGSERAVVWTGRNTTGIGVLFAATYPDRCAALMLLDPRVRGTRSDDYPWAPTEEEWWAQSARIRAGWGERAYLEGLAREWAPCKADDPAFIDWLVWHMRRSLSPGAALTVYRTAWRPMFRRAVRRPGPDAHPGATADREPGAVLADRIPGAELWSSPARGVFTWIRRRLHEATMRGTSRSSPRLTWRPSPETRLATLLFTDIVGSTETAAGR